MRTKFIPLAALALTVSLSGLARAQKIAVIDMQSSLLATKDGQKAAEELKNKFGPKETEFGKRQQDLAAKQETLRKGQNTMSEEAKATAERDIAAITKALQRDADDTKADFQSEENRLLGAILNKMQAVLTKYAADNQITMVVDGSQQPNSLLYWDKSIDISAAVVDRYDQSAGAPPAAGPATTSAPAPAKPAAPPVKKPAAPGGK